MMDHINRERENDRQDRVRDHGAAAAQQDRPRHHPASAQRQVHEAKLNSKLNPKP